MSWTTVVRPGGFRVRWSAEAAHRYKTAGYWEPRTCVDYARERTQEDPDRVLIADAEGSLSRTACYEAALRLGRFFTSRGLVPGDVVSFQLPNWRETAIISLAARMTGLVINPLPPIYREAELGYMLADCRSKLIFVPAQFRKCDHRDMLRKLAVSIPTLKDIVIVRGGDGADLTWSEAVNSDPLDALPTLDSTSVMMVMYTSGTTGRAKGVLHTHASFGYRSRAMIEAWRLTANDIVFMPSPVTHITGAFWSFDMPWIQGFSSVLLDVWTPSEGIAAIEQQKCTISGGATPFLQQLIDSTGDRPAALESLRMFFCGGTAVSPDLIERASRRLPQCLFFRAYGSTEMPTTTLGIRSKDSATLGATTDGEVVYPTEIRIVDASSADVPDGQEGEILARGPEQFAGYLHQDDNDGAFDDDGYFRMGDLGTVVHEKFLVITGRKKDIIIRSGENISPKEVEDVLLTHPAIADVAIVAMPSVATGEKGCAFVVARANHAITLQNIQDFLDSAGLARQKFPEMLVIIADLPRVPSGKIRKDVLRVQARDLAD